VLTVPKAIGCAVTVQEFSTVIYTRNVAVLGEPVEALAVDIASAPITAVARTAVRSVLRMDGSRKCVKDGFTPVGALHPCIAD